MKKFTLYSAKAFAFAILAMHASPGLAEPVELACRALDLTKDGSLITSRFSIDMSKKTVHSWNPQAPNDKGTTYPAIITDVMVTWVSTATWVSEDSGESIISNYLDRVNGEYWFISKGVSGLAGTPLLRLKCVKLSERKF